MTTGLFQLQTPRDMFAKLKHNHGRLANDPNNAYIAFDFFVTAEHLLDWLYPGVAGRSHRSAARNSEILVCEVVSHLATGAKHMIPETRDTRQSNVLNVAPSTYQSGTIWHRALRLESFDNYTRRTCRQSARFVDYAARLGDESLGILAARSEPCLKGQAGAKLMSWPRLNPAR